MFVKSNLRPVLNDDIRVSRDSIEVLWVNIRRVGNNGKLLIGVCYKPPTIAVHAEDKMLPQIEKLAYNNEVPIIWDINYPDINWDIESADCSKGCKFLTAIKKHYLSQLVHELEHESGLVKQKQYQMGTSRNILVSVTIILYIRFDNNIQ